VNDVELDADGPAAPPRANGELVFEHPWQSRIFAATMALCDNGTITYAEFRDRLIAAIAVQPDHYWSCWQDALEAALAERRLCDLDELADRARRFGEHPEHARNQPTVDLGTLDSDPAPRVAR
jgi:hypothetical protein